MAKMTARELVDSLHPKHERTTCDDFHTNNGFASMQHGHTGRTAPRCKRCALLEVLQFDGDLHLLELNAKEQEIAKSNGLGEWI